MANLVNQPNAVNPTRKLTASVVSAALMAVTGLVVRNLAPQWFDATVWAALTPLVSYAAGYFIKDEATTVVVQKVVKSEIPVAAAKP